MCLSVFVFKTDVCQKEKFTGQQNVRGGYLSKNFIDIKTLFEKHSSCCAFPHFRTWLLTALAGELTL